MNQKVSSTSLMSGSDRMANRLKLSSISRSDFMRLFDHEENERSALQLDREFTEIRNEADSVRLRDLISYYCVEGAEDFLELLTAIDAEGIITMDQTDLNQRLIKLLCMN